MQELQEILSLALDGASILAESGRKVNGFVLASQCSLRSTSKTAIIATKSFGVVCIVSCALITLTLLCAIAIYWMSA